MVTTSELLLVSGEWGVLVNSDGEAPVTIEWSLPSGGHHSLPG